MNPSRAIAGLIDSLHTLEELRLRGANEAIPSRKMNYISRYGSLRRAVVKRLYKLWDISELRGRTSCHEDELRKVTGDKLLELLRKEVSKILSFENGPEGKTVWKS